jgi:hypothetical protein
MDIFDEAQVAALTADADAAALQAQIDRLMPGSAWDAEDTPSPAAVAAEEYWRRRDEKVLSEQLRELHRERLEAAAADAAAEAAAVNDPSVIAEEAAALDACDQAKADVRLIDRHAVAVPRSFAPGMPRLFVAGPSVEMLARPKGQYEALPKWCWIAGVRKDGLLSLGRGNWEHYYFVAEEYTCDLHHYKTVWTIARRRSDDVTHVHVERLSLRPWPLVFTDLRTAETLATLCQSTRQANTLFCWVPSAGGVKHPHLNSGGRPLLFL